MDTFQGQYEAFLKEFGKGRNMVLATSDPHAVSARMMSIVRLDGLFFFQTDKNFRKYSQLIQNPKAALCAENIQIEGYCEEAGRPAEHEDFCNVYQECFCRSYQLYTSLPSERLFRFFPVYVERWLYQGGLPFIQSLDLNKRTYTMNLYTGNTFRNES